MTYPVSQLSDNPTSPFTALKVGSGHYYKFAVLRVLDNRIWESPTELDELLFRKLRNRKRRRQHVRDVEGFFDDHRFHSDYRPTFRTPAYPSQFHRTSAPCPRP